MNVYLAGPINGCSDREANDWRSEFIDLLAEHLDTFSIFDPMRRDYRGREDENVEKIVRHDLEDIDASDVVLANCWQVSWGTAMEIFYAHSQGKRVVCVVPVNTRISPWLRHHAHVIVPDLKTAAWTLRQIAHTV